MRGGQEAPRGSPGRTGGRGHLENCIAAFVDIILSVQPAATACSIAGRIDERRIIANTIPPGTRRGKRHRTAKGTNSDRMTAHGSRRSRPRWKHRTIKKQEEKKMSLTIKEFLTINRRRFREFCKGLNKIESEELRGLASWYERLDREQKASRALVDRLLPSTWFSVYARAARLELARRGEF